MAQLKDLLVEGKSRFIDKIYASDQFISKVVQGTSPFLIDSSTLVSNLNVDMVDGQHFTYSNTNNTPTYLWGTSSDGTNYLVSRASMHSGVADKVSTIASTSTGNFYLTFVDSNNTPSAAEETVYTTAKLYIQPSTGDIHSGGYVYIKNTTACLGADSNAVIWLKNSSGYPLVCDGNVVRRGASLTNGQLGSSSAYWADTYTKLLHIDSSSAGAVNHIIFNRANWNYIGLPAGGSFSVNINGTGSANSYLLVNTTEVTPGAKNGIINLGTDSSKWKTVYSTAWMTQNNAVLEDTSGRLAIGTKPSHSAAKGLNVGDLLVSDLWADRTKIPTNGIYSKGQIKSGVAQGTAPFVVDSSTLVSNLNTDLLDGFHLSQITPIVTKRDFSNGTLVKTNISFPGTNTSVSEAFLLTVKGNGYGGGIINFEFQGYVYYASGYENPKIISSDFIIYSPNSIDKIYTMSIDNKLCFWWARQAYWQGFHIFCTTNTELYQNRVTEVQDVSKPTGSFEQNYTPKISLTSSNYTTYTVTKTGGGASGTWGISITGSAGSVDWSNITNKPATATGYGYIGTTAVQATSAAGQDLTGIGTIYIKGNGNNWTEGIRIKPNGSWATILLGGSDLTADTGTSANSWSLHNCNGSFYLAKNGSGTSGTNTAVFQNVSNNWNFAKGMVGIGTAPSTALHVKSDSNTSTATQVSIENATFAQTTYCRAVDATAAAMVKDSRMIYMIGKAGSNSNKAYFGYHHIADGCTNNFATIGLHSHDELLNVLASGNVGIGTTTPSQKLHVAGTIYSSVAQGTAPLKVDSSTLVSNLNVDLLDGKHAAELYWLGRNLNYSSTTTWNGLIPVNAFGFRTGRPVFDDPDLKTTNTSSWYNAGSGAGNVSVVTDASALEDNEAYIPSGNSSGRVIKIVPTSIASNKIGGTSFRTVSSKQNKVWALIFRAFLPEGAVLQQAMNNTGTGRTWFWVTDNKGTGKWEWYACIHINGSGGTYSTFGHTYATLAGAEVGVKWYISYFQVYELTDGEYDGYRVKYADTATSADSATSASSTATTSKVKTIASSSTNYHYVTFVPANNSSLADSSVYTTAKLSVKPSTGDVSVGGDIVINKGANYTSGKTADGAAVNGITVKTNAKSISLGVGTGGTNRGIYNDSSGNWMLYTDNTNLIANQGALIPGTTNSQDLGTTSVRWKSLHLSYGIDSSSTLYIDSPTSASTIFRNGTTEIMRVSKNGTIDINESGNSNTTNKLYVNGRTKIVNGALNVTGEDSYGQGIRIHDRGGYSSVWFRATNETGNDAGMLGFTGDSTGLRVRIPDTSTSNTPVDCINILYGGNIGIGTASPSQKLQVAGTIYSSVAQGTAPLKVDSSTLVSNLNVDLFDDYHAYESQLYNVVKSLTMSTVNTIWYLKITLSGYAQPDHIFVNCSYNNEIDRAHIYFSGMSLGYIYRNNNQNQGNIKAIALKAVYDSTEHLWIFYLKFDKIYNSSDDHYSPSSSATVSVYTLTNSSFNIAIETTEPSGVTWITTGSQNNNLIIKNATLYGDADTVDGKHASDFSISTHNHDTRYLRKDANDSTGYQYLFSKTNDHAIQVGTIRGYTVGSQTGNYLHIYERVHIGSPNGWGSRSAPSYGLSTYGGAWLATDTGNVGIGTTAPSQKLHVIGNIYADSTPTSNASKTQYISAGPGYSTAAGKYGVKVVSCDQSDCQSGLGQDLGMVSGWSGWENNYNLSIAGGNNSSDVGKISFVTHKVNSTTYRYLGGFLDTAGTIKFNVQGTGLFTGSVGIGTNNPTQKLHVTGTIYSSVAQGTAPLKVDSSTLVSNLNVDYLGNEHKYTIRAYPRNNSNILFSGLPYLIDNRSLFGAVPVTSMDDAPEGFCWGPISTNKSFYSDYIEVQPGEVLYGEIWAYRAADASGTAGTLYYGIDRYDRNKKVIGSNSGCTYFVASSATVSTDGVWHKYSGTTTIPTSHTAYSGSDGKGVYYIKIRVLVNYSAGTIPTYIGRIILSRGVQSATSSSKISTIASTATENYYLTFVDSNNSTAADETLYTTAKTTIQPSTGNIVTQGYVAIGTGRANSYLGSDSASNIWLHNSSGYPLVCDGNVIRRGTAMTNAQLGTSSYPWPEIYGTKFKTANYELSESTNSRLSVGNAGQSTAKGLNVGDLLVSSAWADYTKVPTNGIYSKGQVKIGVAQGTAPLVVDSSTQVTNLKSNFAQYADVLRDPVYYRYVSNDLTSGRRTSADINWADGGLHYYLATSSMTTGKPAGDGHILHMSWDNGSYEGQFVLPTSTQRSLQWRSQNGGTWSDWITVIDSSNYGSYVSAKSHNHDSSYVKLSSTEQTIESTISSYAKGVIEFYRSSGDHICFISFANKVSGAKRTLGAIGFYSGGTGKLQYRDVSANYYNILHAGNTSAASVTLSTTDQTFVTVNGTAYKIKLPATIPWTVSTTDKYVEQSESTTANYRGVVLGYNNNASANTGITTTVTNVVYTTNNLTVQPSTGNIVTKGYVAVGTGGVNSYIASDAANNIYLHNSSGAVLVATGKVVRRSTSLADVSLGDASYPWAGVYAKQFISKIAQGTAPLVVDSSTAVSNLNADFLDGLHESAFARKIVAGTTVAMANSGGTITVETNKIILVTTTSTSAVTFNFTWNSPAACDEAHVIITGSGSSKTITIGNVNSDSTNTKKNVTSIKVTSGGYGEISIVYFDSKYFIRAVGN